MSKKFLTIIILALSLAACDQKYRDETSSYKLPKELQDCRIYHLQSDSLSYITVMRCPSASTTTTTTYKSGKTTRSITVE